MSTRWWRLCLRYFWLHFCTEGGRGDTSAIFTSCLRVCSSHLSCPLLAHQYNILAHRCRLSGTMESRETSGRSVHHMLLCVHSVLLHMACSRKTLDLIIAWFPSPAPALKLIQWTGVTVSLRQVSSGPRLGLGLHSEILPAICILRSKPHTTLTFFSWTEPRFLCPTPSETPGPEENESRRPAAPF